MNSILGNLPPVVKNLVIINALMYLAKYIAQMQGLDLNALLGGYVFNSPYFEPYQMVTHFFMHGNFMHIFFNMFALIIFGPILEQVWGPKRFFIFYIATALGAFFLHQIVGYFEVKSIIEQLSAKGVDIYNLNQEIANLPSGMAFSDDLLRSYQYGVSVPVVGASGAVFGVLVAFGYLFPNTKLMLLFPPIPIKAKWLVIGYLSLEVYLQFQNSPGDNVAHLAHIGGAIVGFILVYIWQKQKKNFY